MIHWLWALVAFVAGTMFGMVVIAFAEVSRHSDEPGRKWWEDG